MRMVKGSLLADAMIGLSIAVLIGWYTATLTSIYVRTEWHMQKQEIDWSRKHTKEPNDESTWLYER